MTEQQLQYRPLDESDLVLREQWLNDPETNRYLGTRVRQGTDRAFHERWFDAYEKDDSREIFTILHDGTPIGQVGLLSINTDDKNAELYVLIGDPAYRGKGLGVPIVRHIIDYGFIQLQLHRIYLMVHAANTAAIHVYEKCGFAHEGVLRDSVLRDGVYEDEVVMGLVSIST